MSVCKLSVEDISNHLGVVMKTAQRWVRQGKLPVQRKGVNYTFREQDLKEWASQNNLVLSFDKNTVQIQKRLRYFIPKSLS